MTNVFKTLGNRKFFVLTGAIISLVGISFFYSQTSHQAQSLSVLGDGARTCFGRVQQSFMARMLGDTKSQYLTSEFMGNTEKCFGEASEILEKNFQSEMSEVKKKLNTLSTDVHWFHERISPESDAFTESAAGVLISNIGGRFAKLEMAHGFILDGIYKKTQKISSALEQFSTSLFFSAGIALLFIGLEVRQRWAKAKDRKKWEDEADKLLENNDMAALRVQEVLKNALKGEGLHSCGQLFSQFHFYKTKIGSEAVFASFARPNEGQENNEQMIQSIWDQSEHDDSHLVVYDEMFHRERQKTLEKYDRVPEGAESLSLEETASRMIDHLSKEIFTRGIQIDLDIDDSHLIYASQEELEQVLYQAMGFLIKENSQSLGLRTKQLGQAVVLDIEANGIGFEEKFIKGQLGPQSSRGDLPVEIQICQQLSQDLESKMSYDNLYDDRGEVVGRGMRFTFKLAKDQSRPLAGKKVLNIEKGTKKQILERIQTSS